MNRMYDRGYGRPYGSRSDWDDDRDDLDERDFGADAYRRYRQSFGSGFDYDRNEYAADRDERSRYRDFDDRRRDFGRGDFDRDWDQRRARDLDRGYDRRRARDDDDRALYSSGRYFYEGRRYASDYDRGRDFGRGRWDFERDDFGDRNDFGRDFDTGRGYGERGMRRDFGMERGYGRSPDYRSIDRSHDHYDRGYREGRRRGRPYGWDPF